MPATSPASSKPLSVARRLPISPFLALFMLLSMDMMFMAIAFANKVFEINEVYYFLDQDWSYAERFQYLKFVACAALIAVMSRARRDGRYLACLVVVVYLLIDDALGVHENVGSMATAALGLNSAFRLRGQDFGELLVTGAAATVAIVLLAIARRHADRTFTRFAGGFLGCLMLLGYFGVFIDMLHIALATGPVADFNLAMLEDGGEMVAATLMTHFILVETGG